MRILERFSLENRIAVITGGRRGLGFEIARAFCEAGAHVVLTSRDSEQLDKACRTLENEGGSASFAAFDVADREKAQYELQAIGKKYGRIDILVNNVGARDRRSLDEFTDTNIRDFLDTDLLAAISLTRDAVQLMKENGYGRLIFLSSVIGSMALPADNLYPVAKQGLTGLMRAMAVEYGPCGITSNAIAPGMFATETNAYLYTDPNMQNYTKLRVPLQRWGDPAEIAGSALLLASEAGSFINGQTITVDGGHSVRM